MYLNCWFSIQYARFVICKYITKYILFRVLRYLFVKKVSLWKMAINKTKIKKFISCYNFFGKQNKLTDLFF